MIVAGEWVVWKKFHDTLKNRNKWEFELGRINTLAGVLNTCNFPIKKLLEILTKKKVCKEDIE